MCGQFGTVGDLGKKQDAFTDNMFILDSLRGPDSCGLLGVANYDDDVNIFKRAVSACDFIDMGGYRKVLRVKNKVLMGHNRWSTKGAINSVNAHPFTIGDITGQHNGTLIAQWRLPDSKDFIVDSENIIHAINKVGIKETWSLVDGAAALMWWDEKDDSFNMIRNKLRPMFFCYSKDLKQMYVASERYMLEAALWRNGIERGKMEELPVDVLYSFKVDTLAKDAKEVVKCTTTKLVPFQHVTTTYNYPTPLNTKRLAIGTKVDFYVTEVEILANKFVYTCSDNTTDDIYKIEDWGTIKQLEVNDLAMATVQRSVYGQVYLNPHSIENSVDWEWSPADEDTYEEWELGSGMTDADWEVFKGKDCDLCGSPITKGDNAIATTGGQHFCSDCKDNSLVKMYTHEKEAV